MSELKGLLTPENLAYLAGAFYVSGLAITNQIVLRSLVLIGTCIYIAYYSTVSASPLWSAIYVSIMIGLANSFGLTSLLARRSRFAIPRAHADIYPIFPALPPGDFRALMKLATRKILPQDTQITTENEIGKKLYFVVNGSALVRKGDKAFVLPPNIFVGEIAFLIGRASSASVWLEQGAEILEWDFSELRRRCARSPRFKLALEAAISTDLASKVADSMGRDAVRLDEIPAPLVDQLPNIRAN